jgi:DNA mismatch repair protein MSH4
LQPIYDEATLNMRLDAVEELLKNEQLFGSIITFLEGIKIDICAMLGELMRGKTNRKTNTKIAQHFLKQVAGIFQALNPAKYFILMPLNDANCRLLRLINSCIHHKSIEAIHDRISNLLQIDENDITQQIALNKIQLSFVVKPNVDPLLDVARKALCETADDIQNLFSKYREVFGSSSDLKLRYYERRGYFLESKSPPPNDGKIKFVDVIEKESTGMKRNRTGNKEINNIHYEMTTLELDSASRKNCDAQARILELSAKIVAEVVEFITENSNSIISLGDAISLLDMIQSHATYAASCSGETTRPEFTNSGPIAIRQGRNPVFGETQNQIPNDSFVNSGVQLLTGPNNSGKSYHLRQIVLLSILGMTGSLVPANYACFRLFSRIICCSVGNRFVYGITGNEGGALAQELLDVKVVLDCATNPNILACIDEV